MRRTKSEQTEARIDRTARGEPGRTLDSMIRPRIKMRMLLPTSLRLPCHQLRHAGIMGADG